MVAVGARVWWCCLVLLGIVVCAQAQDAASKPQVQPEGTPAAAAAGTAYFPDAPRWNRKDSNSYNNDRDQPYSHSDREEHYSHEREEHYGDYKEQPYGNYKDEPYSSDRDQQYRDEPYGSDRDQHYGHYKEDPYGHKYGPKPYPYPPHGGNGGGGDGVVGGPNDQLKPPAFVQEACIKNIDDFAEAFNKGGVNRCVDDKIIIRLDQWFARLNETDPAIATTKNNLFRNFVQKQGRTTTFWSYGDNPEKYIRIGRDKLTLGNFVDNPSENNTGLQTGNFPGLVDFSNFAGLLESIGYSSVDTRPKAGYMMVITYKPTKTIQDNLPLPVYNPTWQNIVTYIQWFISNIAAADDAAGAAAGVNAGDYANFKFDASTVKFLENTTFSDLTGCQAQCTVQDTNFGNAGDSSWDSPCLEVERLSSTSCNSTNRVVGGRLVPLSPASRYEFTEPTAVNAFDEFCSAKFKAYRNSITYSNFCGGGALNSTRNRALALQVAKAYKAATDAKDKVLVLRAYLLSGCAGSYNALFTGNGFTASGNGGFWQATGTEIHTGEVTPQKLPTAFPRVRVLFFCPYSQNGQPYTHAICPESIVGKLNVSAILKEPSININQAWDVQEVFHPEDPSKPSGSRAKKDRRSVNMQSAPVQG